MEWESFTTDELEQRLIASRAVRSRLDAGDMEILEVLDTRQVATGDGARSLSEWVAARVDIGPDSARMLVRSMRRTVERPDLREALANGEATLDRVEAVSRIPGDVGLMLWADVSRVRREAAKRARISAAAEHRSSDDQFMVIQPTLDESWWKLWGGLDGPTGALVDKALTEKADSLPDLPDGRKGDAGWRKAMALAEVCVSGEAPPATVTVFVDARTAADTSAEAGVVLGGGVKAGRQALEAILCDSVTEVIARTEDGRYMEYGRRQRTAPPALKQALLDKYGHRCCFEGCDSRYRLEAHHLVPYSEGGTTEQDVMILPCWFHHHVVIHQRGFKPYQDADTGRWRLRPSDRPT